MMSRQKYLAIGFLLGAGVLLFLIYYSGINRSMIFAPFNSVYVWIKPVDLVKWNDPVTTIKWTHPVCKCTRDIPLYSPPGTDSQLKSKCGPVADVRGPHQRVMSYVFYGDVTSDYFKGILRISKEIPIRYPGWVMRLYHDIPTTSEKNQKALCDTICTYPTLDDCYVGDLSNRIGYNLTSKFGMLWRFLPLGDPLVDIFNVRDIDSTVYQREVDAVNQWLRSDKIWHVLRDNPYHTVDMLGGGWGVKNSEDLPKMTALLDAMLTATGEKKYGFDEMLLSKIVFPEALKSLLSHDSFGCKKRPNTTAYPTQRVGKTFIVDKVHRSPGLVIQNECPIECRPANHKDWLYC